MDNIFTRKQLNKMIMELYWDMINSGNFNKNTYPLNIGKSKMNKKELANLFRLMDYYYSKSINSKGHKTYLNKEIKII